MLIYQHPLKMSKRSFVFLLCLLGLGLGQDYKQQNSWGGDCQTGENQSPINIVGDVAGCDNQKSFTLTSRDENYTQIAYNPHNKNLQTPFTLSTITIKDLNDNSTKEFKALQFHFHHTAEHQINGVTHAAELHVVHKADDGSLAVVGFIFKAERKGLFSDPFDRWSLDTKTDIQQKFPIPLVTPKKVYHYQGSLTTPTCTEGVNWFVSGELIHIKQKNL